MPKVVIRGNVSASNDKNEKPRQALNIYYCICSEFMLVSSHAVDALPVRPLDKAQILIRGKHNFKLNTNVQEKPILIKHSDDNGTSYEKRFIHTCPRCQLPIAYTSAFKDATYTYVLPGSLTTLQGKVHKSALQAPS